MKKTIIRTTLLVILGGPFLAGGVPAYSQDSQEKLDFEYGQKLVREGLHDLSVIQFQRFITRYPSSPRCAEAQFLCAESQFEIKSYSQAREGYLRTILGYPAFPLLDQCQFRTGECFEQEGKRTEAAESYYRVYLYHPRSKWKGEALYRAARLASSVQNHEKAESLLRLLLESDPSGETHSKAVFLLADELAAGEDYQRAVGVLAPLAARPVLDGDAVRALLAMGKIYEDQGRFEEALTQYEKAATSKQADMQGLADARRGRIMRMMGKDREAMSAFDKALLLLTDSGEKNRVLTGQAEISFGQGNAQTALDKLERMKGPMGPSVLYMKGRCLETVKRFSEAEPVFSSLAADTATPHDIRKKSLLSGAHGCVQTGRFERAMLLYGEYLKTYPGDGFADAVLFQKGRLYLDSLDLPVDAGIVFQTLWENYPDSPFVPQSRFMAAENAAGSGRFEDARRLFETVADRTPCTPWADSSLDRMSRLPRPEDLPLQNGFPDLSSLLLGSEASPFRLGCVFMQKWGWFSEALKCFEAAIAAAPPSSRPDSAYYFSGLCYEALSMTGRQPAGLDSAQRRYSSLLSLYPDSPLVPPVLLKQIQASGAGNSVERYTGLDELQKRYPPLKDDASYLFALGVSAQNCDSIQKAVAVFEDLSSRFSQSPLREEALYRSALLRLKAGRHDLADSLLSLYSTSYPRGRRHPSVLMTRAKMAGSGKAVGFLEDLRARFRHATVSDSGGIWLGDLYLGSGRFAEAAAIFETLSQRDSLYSLGESTGIPMPYARCPNSVYLKWARACENLGRLKKARQLYMKYGLLVSAAEDRAGLYAALSRVCEKQDQPAQAAAYLGLAADILPADSTYLDLGAFHFRSGRYAEAGAAWKRGLALASQQSMKGVLESNIMTAEIRQDRIAGMDVRVREFAKFYQKEPGVKTWSGGLNLELAMAYTRQKDFDPALKCLKEVQKDKDSPLYPESEVETGKILLITNKTDKALELLSELPEKYPNHPVLGSVYLNLGDHYFRSQQFENALTAFKKAAADTSDATVSATALRFMIKIYDALQMVDAALATTRQYIRRFPKAEDILEKRIQIGVFSASLKDFSSALESFRDVQKDATDDMEAEIQYWIGKCYYETGQFEEAVLEFLKVKYVSKPTQLPWAATALYEAGTAYMRLKDRDKARQMFQIIVSSEGAASDLGRIAVKRIQEIDGARP